MKIYVWAPNFTRSGGIKALHYFMYLAERNGHQVYTTADKFDPDYQYHPTTAPYTKGLVDMMVVPEIGFLEQIGVTNLPVLRWVLYFPGKLAGPKHYGPSEIVYYWNDDYKESAIAASYYKEAKRFGLPHLVKSEFEFEPQPRNGDLFFVYKGTNMHRHPENATEITPGNTNERIDLLRLLRTHKTLYTYDRHTILSAEATLSGMSVKVFNYDKDDWEDYVMDPSIIRYRNDKTDAGIVAAKLADFVRQAKAKGLGRLK